jgi:hypothetical protein
MKNSFKNLNTVKLPNSARTKSKPNLMRETNKTNQPYGFDLDCAKFESFPVLIIQKLISKIRISQPPKN